MIPAFTVEQIRAAEAAALARAAGRGDALMRRAAAEVAGAITDRLGRSGPVTGRSAVLLVGSGHNGGDALYAGALLRRRGMAVTALLTNPARAHPGGLAALTGRRGRILTVADEIDVGSWLDRADVIVDGLVGLAGRPPLRDPAGALVGRANAASALRVAVDLPSGVDPDTGATDGPVFDADVTVTFGGMKPGLLLATAAGEVIVAELGLMPPAASARVGVLTEAEVAALTPRVGPESDKYSGGVPGIVAGSARYPGAAVLCVGGAVRLRPGMVRYAGPQGPAVVAAWPEVVPADDPARAGTVQAWAVGPGLGTDEAALARLATVIAADVPVVVDADGLTLLAQHPELLAARAGRPTVLTPHAGEFARVFPDLELADRIGAVRAAARRAEVTVLLKGSRTLVAAPDGRVLVNTTGSPVLATAGSGDVLSGMIGSLLAAGLDPLHAAAAAAHRHGRAGERAAADHAYGAPTLWSRLYP